MKVQGEVMLLNLIIKLKLKLYSHLFGYEAGRDLLIIELEAYLNECCRDVLGHKSSD